MTAEQSTEKDPRRVSRRRMLEVAGTAGIMGLAGCGGDNGQTPTSTDAPDGSPGESPTDTGGSDTSGTPLDDTFTVPITADPSNFQFNPYNFTQPFHSPMQGDLLFQRNLETNEIMPYGAEFGEITKRHITLNIREGWTWHNGDPVTGKDVEAFFVLQKMTGREMSRFIKGASSDGKTTTVNFNQDVGRKMVEWSVADPEGRRIASPWRIFKEWIQKWRDASTEDARSEVVGNLRSATFDEPYGNGPFQVSEVNSRHVLLEKYEDHPDADNINFPYFEHLRISNPTGALAGLEVDGDRNLTVNEAVYTAFPDTLQLVQIPALWGLTLAMNHEDEDFGRRRVRQALAYVIDRKAVGNNYGFNGVGVVAPSGLVGNINSQGERSDAWKRWVTDSAASQLNRYKTNDQNLQKATQLLEEAGYTKENGQWMTPNGDRFRAPIKVPSNFTSALSVYRSIVSQLSQFGIQASMVPIQDSVYWPNHYLAGNFRLGATGWTLSNPYPYYVQDFMYNIDAGFYNLPEEIQAPPLGSPNAAPQTVGVNQKLSDMLSSSDEQEQKQLAGELAWTTNWYLPMMPIIEINDMVWFTTDQWNTLPSDDPRHQMKWAMWFHPRKGWTNAKTE